MDARAISGTQSFALAVALAAVAWSCAAPAADTRVIAEQNLFDPQRKPWPEPAAPAAAAKPLAAEDIQVQGIVMHAGVRRAIVKLGGRLRALAPGGANARPEVILSEGQALGGYTLESVQAQQLVFASGGERYTVALRRNAPRDTAGAQPAPLPVIQSATLPVAESRPTAQPAPIVASPQTPPSAPPRTTQVPAAAAAGPAQAGGQFPGTQQGGAAPTAPVPMPATSAAPATGMTLLQAIQAAEAARRAGQGPAAPVNPFQPRSQP